nr:MAG TPA: hypothetical protein [Caudoviricetes sp.]
MHRFIHIKARVILLFVCLSIAKMQHISYNDGDTARQQEGEP